MMFVLLLRLSDIPWIPWSSAGSSSARSSSARSSSTPELGQMEVVVDVRKRNDTGRPNSSPYVSLPPYIG